MSFRRRIILLLLLPVIVALLAGLLSVWGRARIRTAEENRDLSRRLATAVTALNFVSDRYLIYGREEVFDEWLALHRRMGELLQHLQGESPLENMLLAELAASHRKLGAIMNAIRNESRGRTEAPRDILPQRLDEAAVLKLRMMYSDSLRILRLNEQHLQKTRELITVLAVGGVFAGVVAASIIGIVTGRRIISSVQILREGTEKVAAGDYSTRVEVPMDHDLQALADSFNAMTEKIEQHSLYMEAAKKALEIEVHLSKKAETALARENETRVRAEEALRKLNNELEARVRERTAEVVRANELLEKMREHSDRQAYTVRRQSQQVLENQRRLERVIVRSRSLFGFGSVEEVFQEIVAIAREAVNARFSVIGHGFRGEKMSITAASRAEGALPCPDTATFTGERGGVYRDLLAKGIDVCLTDQDLRSHPAWWGLPKKHIPLRGLLAVPVVGETRQVVGMLMVSDRMDGEEFDKDDELVLLHLATLASMALQCVMLRGCNIET